MVMDNNDSVTIFLVSQRFIMPWTATNYPNSMRDLNEEVRGKAIDIVNALLKEGFEEGPAISIAIAQARKWATVHGKTSDRSLV